MPEPHELAAWLLSQPPETEVTRKVAAAYLGLKQSTLAAYASDRVALPYRRSAGKKGTTYYTKAALDAWKARGNVEVAV
ncbi:MAG: hypothetical protein BWK73_25525 [Thiothrix lacustris]|uniref:DNA-binding protein n=1 Tax=Thiothrix lacustris TaxID=525917 RepID=A0A1Y1QLC4_9GAMM|nr:MAG: hypothetical protein BWK73_25525 [Thiothrix lacustris]